MRRLKIFFYYLLVKNLPHSRYSKLSNVFRCWYVTNILGIMKKNKNNFFESNIYIGNGNNVSIGANSHINENVFIQGAKIGSYVMIAPNVSILTKGHVFKNLHVPMIVQGETIEKIPVIDDNVWIGRNVVIMPGIHVGKGSIIGAGAVVTKNVVANSIMGGIPAKVIKTRK